MFRVKGLEFRAHAGEVRGQGAGLRDLGFAVSSRCGGIWRSALVGEPKEKRERGVRGSSETERCLCRPQLHMKSEARRGSSEFSQVAHVDYVRS